MLVLIANLTSLNYETVVVGKDPDDMEHKLDMHLLFSHNLNNIIDAIGNINNPGNKRKFT